MASSRQTKGRLLSEEQFQKIWSELSGRLQAEVRARADEFGMTLKDVLNRWPTLRKG
jgi:hypothetical protein